MSQVVVRLYDDKGTALGSQVVEDSPELFEWVVPLGGTFTNVVVHIEGLEVEEEAEVE